MRVWPTRLFDAVRKRRKVSSIFAGVRLTRRGPLRFVFAMVFLTASLLLRRFDQFVQLSFQQGIFFTWTLGTKLYSVSHLYVQMHLSLLRSHGYSST